MCPRLGVGTEKILALPLPMSSPEEPVEKVGPLCRAELRFWVALCRRVLFYLHFSKAAITKVHS